MKAMITVCGEFTNDRDKFWVASSLLTDIARLAQGLCEHNIEVEHVGSMDNAQMIERNALNGVDSEARLARACKVDFLYFLFQDERREFNIFKALQRLKELLPSHITLVACGIHNDRGLTCEQKKELERMGVEFITQSQIQDRRIPIPVPR